MRSILKYICLSALLCICCSCDLEEFEPHTPSKVTIEFIARPADYSNLDVTTKSEPTADFETAIYTAYLLLFDASGNRIYFSDVDPESRLQRVTLKGLSTVTACFIANINKADIEDITTIDDLNSVVLDIKYASYSEAYNHLGVPKLTVSGTSYPCFPMIGIKSMDVSQMTNIEIPLTRLFAKISVNIKMQLTNIGIGQISPTLVNYELDQYQLHNLPTKVSLIKNNDEDSAWKSKPDAFTGKSDMDPVSSPNYLGLQTININDQDNNSSNNSGNVPGIGFYLYVPEYYLSPKTTTTDNQKWKPENYDSRNYAIYLELIGEVNQGLIDNTGIRHKIYLGGDNTKDFTLKRNVNYINQITITGITKNDKGTGEDLDHRVSSEIINNPVAQAGKAANCYIIAKPGEYTIPAYKGAYNVLANATLCMAGKDLSEYDTRVDILANMVEYENLTSITFSKDPVYDAETNTISFTVNPMLSNNWVPNGCVIMALQYRRKGETEWITEWSWHLWFVFNIESSEDGWGTIGSQKMPDGKTEMMDRNLGVNFFPIPLVNDNAGSKIGFYYKYGEHTPYLDPDGDGIYTKHGGGSIDGSSPTWNNSAEKSETDPCPPGYRVPKSEVWEPSNGVSPVATHSPASLTKSWMAFEYWDEVYFPYSRYVAGDTMAPEQIETKKTDQVKGFTKAYNVPEVGKEYSLVEYGVMEVWKPMEYRNLTYSYSEHSYHGYLWSLDSDYALSYKHITSSSISINCEAREGTIVWKTNSFWGIPYSVTCKSISWKSWSEKSNLSSSATGYSDLKNAVDSDISSKGYKNESDMYDYNYKPPQDYGLQIRCVKEQSTNNYNLL